MTQMERLLDCLRTARESFPEDHEIVREARVDVALFHMRHDGSVLAQGSRAGSPLCDYPSYRRAMEAA